MRMLKFNVVGVAGFGVQIAVLGALDHLAWTPAWAALVAVEAAILHNFVWHEYWTWRGRRGGGWLQRLARFQLSNGLVSVAGNVWLTAWLTGAGLPLVAANALAVVVCSLANYV